MKKYITIPLLTLFGILTSASTALAQGVKSASKNLEQTIGKTGISTNNSVGDVAGLAINVALSLIGVIFLILMVYSGFLWMTARGAEDQVKKARDGVISAVIGLVLVLSAYAITVLITGSFGTL